MAAAVNPRTLRVPLLAMAPMLALMGPCLAQESPPQYLVCSGCHGANGEGNQDLKAPPLAGQSADYLARQLTKFKNGQRAYLPKDEPGQVMKAIAQTLEGDAAIRSVAEYISRMPRIEAAGAVPPAQSPVARSAAAARVFTACVGCHGERGEGKAIASAPNLALLPSWYVTKALADFKTGARGAIPGDHEGRTMRALVRLIPDDQALQDVAEYIDTL